LAQEFMYALGIPTSRSLTLFVSKTDKVQRPWYSYGTHSKNPDILVDNPIAISTRVAHSFLRVGQLELFSRRVRNQSHPNAYEELMMIVKHVVQREYKNEIDQGLPFEKQIIELAKLFRGRLTRLIAQWIRVGYCQGNFNSDNCSVGGHTLDYGPFGFCESFDPDFQPWTGGGQHFSFFNQPNSAQANFHMFLTALRPLLSKYPRELSELDQIFDEFAPEMKSELEKVWALKLGLITFIPEIFNSLMDLMIKTHLDFTIFFRELSHLPESIHPLKKSFYQESSKDLDQAWQSWLSNWREQVKSQNNLDFQEISTKMKQINPKYTWREWTVVPAYQSAMKGDYSLLRELQEVLSRPYEEQSIEIESKYYQLKPNAFFNVGGISHYSCSS
ncbi:MAG: YdiU family protein, partial [Halobacteriovoraceae bacterium]|nr:YdiU family protein [Halobacteriovoraceae bacterium]